MSTIKDDHAASIYRAISLRFYTRYVKARQSAEAYGGDLADHGRLPTLSEVSERYEAELQEWFWDTPLSAIAALALTSFAGILAADQLVGEVMLEPGSSEKDAFAQIIALANLAGWLNKCAMAEYVEQVRGGKGEARP
jgi:hypothetical protein